MVPRPLALSRGKVLMCLHLAGHNRTEAARLAGVSRATFFNAMRRLRIRAPDCRARKLTAHDVTLIRALSGEGLSLRAIAHKFDVSPTLVSRVADGFGRCTQ